MQTSDGRQHGPMTQAQLERLVSSGRLDSFCRLRHQTWSKWKWAEDLFPQLAQSDKSASTGDDAQQAVAAQTAPSGGHAVWTGEGPAATAGPPAESRPGRKPGILGSTWGIALVVGSAAVLLLIAVAGLGVGWWLWKSHRFLSQYDNEAQALLDELSVPAEPPAVSPDEIEAAMQQAATEVVKRLDGEFRTADSAKRLIEQTQFSADLMQALAQGDLDAIPDTVPAELAPENSTSYLSLYDSLYSECLAYLRENVSRKEFTKQAVWDAARRWEEGKRALLEKQLTEELEKHLAPSRQPR